MLDAYFRRARRWSLLLALLLLLGQPLWAQQTHKKVVLQGFWWDYWNSNYPAGWANYLADLAPRLKALGIDAVWIPPTAKNKNAVSDVGYSPFDHYDLGDKYQKGATGTRVGTKDELLRLIAVLHANGIEVVQDVVLNHADGAGTASGAGGQDSARYARSSNNGYKTFRYACYASPLPETGETAAEYLVRQGRWSKNYPNFHAHAGHNTTFGDMAAPHFGPDFCYGADDGGSDGYGPSTNSPYNPAQGPGYSRDQARSWLLWLKKQTGVDGFRWDAVKHFSYAAQQDWSYHLKYLAGWANGGPAMFNVGEFVGGGSTLDGYVNDVNGQNNGSEFMMGTFDFGLRDGLYGMVTQNQNGGFDLGSLPGYQQGRRVAQYGSGSSAVYVHRTVPFVNNHDTFRPQVDASGNYTGWNGGSELAPHIDPFDPRLSAAYAVAFAVDGSPQIFFEDLFNVGGTGKRFSHLPTSTTDLPTRDDLVNLLWCHQNLNFKDGAYKVRHQAADHLVIERSTKALIGINDNWDTWQETYVDSDFAPGTRLVDYSGANGSYVYVVPQDQRVRINTPPCNGSALFGRRGYSVWAPEGQGGSVFAPARSTRTTQEWELADDLGDQNCRSLGQGGRLPDNSTNQRVVGKIYAQAGQPVSYELYPELGGRDLTFGLYDQQGSRLHEATGSGTITGGYTPVSTGWLTLKLRNTSATYAGQRCFVKASYTAPPTLDARATPAANTVAIWTGNDNSSDPGSCRNWEGGLQPSAGTDVIIPAGSAHQPSLSGGTLLARSLTVEAGASLTLAAGSTLRLSGNLSSAGTLSGPGTLEMAGSSTQTLSGPNLSLARLTISNPADVQLLSPLSVTEDLTLSSGHLLLGDHNLTLAAAATISGANTGRYVVTKDSPASGGSVVRPAPAGATLLYPVGTSASYTPLTLQNTGSTAPAVPVRVFGAVLQNGTGGAPHAQADAYLSRTWDISPTGPLTAALTFQWNSTDENAGFDRSRAVVMHYNGNGSWGSYATTPVSGTGPYLVTAYEVSGFSPFSIGTGGTVLPVTLLDFTAQRRGTSAVLLRWRTAQELNNARFEVEKSADGRDFRRIGQLAGHGTSTRAQAYELVDAEAAGAAYYRLRQLDHDGTASYGPVRYVAAELPALALYPNPTTGDVQLVGLPAAARPALTLRTAPGREVLRTAALPPAEAQAALSAALRRAAPGLYVLTISLDGRPQHLKVVKQ